MEKISKDARKWLNQHEVIEALDESLTDFLILLWGSNLTNSESLNLLNELESLGINYKPHIEPAYRYILTQEFENDEIPKWTSLLSYIASIHGTFIGWSYQEAADFAWREQDEWFDSVTMQIDKILKYPIIKSIWP